MNLPAYISLVAGIVGIVGVLGAAVFYLKFTATKSNLEGKDETIETLEKSRNAYRDRNEELEKELAAKTAENTTLREIATQTPEILALTAVVTESVGAQNKVATNVAKMTGKVSQLIAKLEKKGTGGNDAT